MDFRKLVALTFLLCLVVPVVSATDPARINLTGNAGWLVANGADTARMTVEVRDGNGTPLKDCVVALHVDPGFGRLTSETVVTGASGTAAATFTTGITSGVAVITA